MPKGAKSKTVLKDLNLFREASGCYDFANVCLLQSEFSVVLQKGIILGLVFSLLYLELLEVLTTYRFI